MEEFPLAMQVVCFLTNIINIMHRTVNADKYLQASHLQICVLHREFDLWLVMEVDHLNSNIKHPHQKCSPC